MRVYRYNQRRRKLAKKIKGEEKTDMVLFIWRRSLRFFKWFDWKFLLKLRCCGLVGLEMNSESVKNPLHSSKPFSEYNWTIGSMGTVESFDLSLNQLSCVITQNMVIIALAKPPIWVFSF
jgi:hypothetical protein